MSIPVYVQVDEQQAVLDTIDELKEQLLSAKKILHELYDLREQENELLFSTKQRVEHIHERISHVEEVLGDE